jgi:uncharacterized protein
MNEVDAGPFGVWLDHAQRVLRGEAEADVPCGTCTGCCTSAYYIRIRARDRAAVAGISSTYLVRPPGIPPDEALMAWRHDGSCPALENDRCSIYAQRPLTCRDYDCRVFAAAGMVAGDERKAVINARVRAWRFRFDSDDERRRFEAVRRAAFFIREHRDSFPENGAGVPTAPTGIAVLAIKAHEVFLSEVDMQVDAARIAGDIIQASRAFDSRPTQSPLEAPVAYAGENGRM